MNISNTNLFFWENYEKKPTSNICLLWSSPHILLEECIKKITLEESYDKWFIWIFCTFLVMQQRINCARKNNNPQPMIKESRLVVILSIFQFFFRVCQLTAMSIFIIFVILNIHYVISRIWGLSFPGGIWLVGSEGDGFIADNKSNHHDLDIMGKYLTNVIIVVFETVTLKWVKEEKESIFKSCKSHKDYLKVKYLGRKGD